MPVEQDAGSEERNRLLAALPREEYEPLLASAEVVTLGFKEILYDKNQPIEHVYFPRRGVYSIMIVLEEGEQIEVATVGNEGMLGVPVFLGGGSIPGRCFCQISGETVRLGAQTLNEQAAGGSALQQILHRYTQALLSQIAQSAACNPVHSIDQRCARWLLMTHDRVGGGADPFPLTHEFLAAMLGVRRAGVTESAGRLQKAGLIRYTHGKMTIIDRPGLEAAACECYGVIRREFDRLVGGPPGQ